ncbi:LOW QUALITY PROTEIN: tumor-associated calcium signal transducer 2 [Rhynochetos jubatus]
MIIIIPGTAWVVEPLLGVLLGWILVTASSAQNNGTCETNKWTACAQDESRNCTCTLVGSDHKVNCSTLTSKCWLMRAETIIRKGKRFRGHFRGLLDNDGIYIPDCDDSGIFKARLNDADTCWCVNTAGVGRSEKGDKSLNCRELVKTNWIYIELKYQKRSSAFDVADLTNALKHLFQSRYKLHPKYIASVRYASPFIQIRLNDDSAESRCDVDIADVAYYFEKDINHDSLFPSNCSLTVSGDALDIDHLWIYYIDEKPPEFSMRQVVGGISVVVRVVLSAGFGIAVLVIARWLCRRKHEKIEAKEMDAVRAPSLQLL